jgi:hypothetical protein
MAKTVAVAMRMHPRPPPIHEAGLAMRVRQFPAVTRFEVLAIEFVSRVERYNYPSK